MKHNFKEWLIATRYWSFPVSTMPVVVTLAYLSSYKLIQWDFRAVILAVMVLTGMLALHTAGNLLSDYFDYKKGVDNENAFSVPNLVFHKFEPKEYFVAGSIFALAGSALGILISLICGWEILLIGIVGVALTLLYSPLKFNALGDLDIFLNFSILPILGTSYVMTGGFVWSAAILALPLGVITVSVLHANNTRDMMSDKEAGIKTFAMLLGVKASARLYIAYMIMPFLCIAGAIVAGLLPLSAAISLFALVKAFGNIKEALKYKEKGIEAMTMLDLASVQLQLMFSGLLTIGFILNIFI